MEDDRLIEFDFPFEHVSKVASRETLTRKGHISTLHPWWARRPLVASRTSIAASLIAVNEKEKEKIRRAKEILSTITTVNLDSPEAKKALSLLRELIQNQDLFNGEKPKVLDPFAGGGSIPLEAMRLGCDVHAIDYNPVAVLILKATLQYPLEYSRGRDGLARDLERWGNEVWRQAKNDLKFGDMEEHNDDIKGNDEKKPVAYLWTKVIRCPNPRCKHEIPLFKQFWLSRKKDKKIALIPRVNDDSKKITFTIQEGRGPESFPIDPSRGTINRANVTCLACNATIDSRNIKESFSRKNYSERLIVVIEQDPKIGKTYRLPRKHELELLLTLPKKLEMIQQELAELLEENPLPVEFINPRNPTQDGHGTRCVKYGFQRFSDLFNSRQLLTLLTLMKHIILIEKELETEGYSKTDQKILLTYLSLIFSSLTNYCSRMQRWVVNWEVAAATFSRQAIPMVWDYVELNVLHPRQGWKFILNWMIDALKSSFLDLNPHSTTITIHHGSSLNLPYSSDYFDAVITDPPYHDNINYSELSDYFYVWLKRLLRRHHPELFTHPLTPKQQEIVADPQKHGSKKKARIYFEKQLTKAFKEIYRVLKPGGIAVIVYAHRSTTAWESFITAVAESGFVVTAAWPIRTEMTKRLRAKKSAALTSSIYLIARKLEKKPACNDREFTSLLKTELKRAFTQYWRKEHLNNSDLFMILLGKGLEAFTRHVRIYTLKGDSLSINTILSQIHSSLTNNILEALFEGHELGPFDELTKVYLIWRWLFGKKLVEYDEIRKLLQAFGVQLNDLVKLNVMIKKGSYLQLLSLHEVEQESSKEREKSRQKKALEEKKNLMSTFLAVIWHWKKQGHLPRLSAEQARHVLLMSEFLVTTCNENDPERTFLVSFMTSLQTAMISQ